MIPEKEATEFWKRCSSCKREIDFEAPYFSCSVSTCQGKRTGLVFCSTACWDAHLGFANHRSAYAEESWAPSKADVIAAAHGLQEPERGESVSADRDPVRRIVRPGSTAIGSDAHAAHVDYKGDVLVVVSKVKQWIRDHSQFNTSQCCIEALTRKVAAECVKGVERAKAAGRKTVMGRDIL